MQPLNVVDAPPSQCAPGSAPQTSQEGVNANAAVRDLQDMKHFGDDCNLEVAHLDQPENFFATWTPAANPDLDNGRNEDPSLNFLPSESESQFSPVSCIITNEEVHTAVSSITVSRQALHFKYL